MTFSPAWRRRIGIALIPLLWPSIAFVQSTPELPEGLAEMGGGTGGPVLTPSGQTVAPASDPIEKHDTPIEILDGLRVVGFAELRQAERIHEDPLQGGSTVSEFRLHLDLQTGKNIIWSLSFDAIGDRVVTSEKIDLREGTGPVDLRKANVFFNIGDSIDVRLGRQILTWGTGDLIFVNDVFPKDYPSFIAGRSDDYLKAPTDGVRLSAYTDVVNADLVVMAPWQTNRYITGKRISFTDPNTSQPTNTVPHIKRPKKPSIALRFFRTFGSVETALYGYVGHWQSLAGQDKEGRGIFPDLNVWGASVRGPMFGGIGSLEFAFYDSKEDRNGKNPMISNSEWRGLLGYEREIAKNTTLGLQYSLTRMQDHNSYLDGLISTAVRQPETRDLATLRLTRLFLGQNLTTSAFLAYSPTQDDGFLRVSIDYNVTDTFSIGGLYSNFYGDKFSYYGQFSDADNMALYARINF